MFEGKELLAKTARPTEKLTNPSQKAHGLQVWVSGVRLRFRLKDLSSR